MVCDPNLCIVPLASEEEENSRNKLFFDGLPVIKFRNSLDG